MSKIIGLSTVGHDCGVAYIVDGKIKHCFAEERFTRLKGVLNQFVFPTFSLQKLQELEGISIYDEDVIVVMPKMVLCGFDELRKLCSKKEIQLYEHHYAHACSSYYISGFKDDTLIITYDGGDSSLTDANILTESIIDEILKTKPPLPNPKAHISDWYVKWRESVKLGIEFDDTEIEYPILLNKDSQWGTEWKYNRDIKYSVSLGTNNQILPFTSVAGTDSLASLWHDVTDLLGFVGGKDEGKLVGLAAQGKFNQEMYDAIGHLFDFSNFGVIDYKWGNLHQVTKYISTLDLTQFSVKQDVAYMLQMFTEQYMLDFILYFKTLAPHTTKLCLAGGIFANVKLNQKINEYLDFEEIFVAPAMSDEGLALGAAIAHAVKLQEFKVTTLPNLFLGNPTYDTNIPSNIKTQKFDAQYIAQLLQKRKVIGIYANNREWGPRALGATSIMYDPSDPKAQEYINFRLNRSEVMPFAPVVLSGKEDLLFYCYKSKYAAEFMTLCYNVKEQWAPKIPGVINTFDNTARPQIVKPGNEPFYSILDEFNKLTGIPCTMNTSFNIHGEPIINHPQEAINHLQNGVIDYLILNNQILSV